MKFSDKQWAFLKDVGKLIEHINKIGWKATGGDLYRSREEQERKLQQGLSKAAAGQSRHQDRLAIDLNLWDENGDYIPNLKLGRDDLKDKLEVVASFWRDLNPRNRWGGDWQFFDPYHFERGL